MRLEYLRGYLVWRNAASFDNSWSLRIPQTSTDREPPRGCVPQGRGSAKNAAAPIAVVAALPCPVSRIGCARTSTWQVPCVASDPSVPSLHDSHSVSAHQHFADAPREELRFLLSQFIRLNPPTSAHTNSHAMEKPLPLSQILALNCPSSTDSGISFLRPLCLLRPMVCFPRLSSRGLVLCGSGP
jgi:hypothetical protein